MFSRRARAERSSPSQDTSFLPTQLYPGGDTTFNASQLYPNPDESNPRSSRATEEPKGHVNVDKDQNSGPASRQWRISSRLLIAHILHGLLLGLTIITLVVSIGRWEHNVSVELDKVTQVTSAITISVQIFFTLCIMILYGLTSSVGIDMAIRHPRNISDLDYRLQAWFGGLGPALSHGLLNFKQVKLISKSILFGIPSYLVAGEVLKVTSSSVLGVNIYNATTSVGNAAQSHLTPFAFPNLQHYDQDIINCTMNDTPYEGPYYHVNDLWAVSKETIKLTPENDTTHPGLVGNALYDIIDSSLSFDEVKVNATRMNVRCDLLDSEQFAFDNSSLSESSQGYTLLLAGSLVDALTFYPTLTTKGRWAYGNTTSQAGFPISIDITFGFNATQYYVQPWSYDSPLTDVDRKGVSNDFVFVMQTGLPEALLLDASGSIGSATRNLSLIQPDPSCAGACESGGLNNASAACVDYLLAQPGCITQKRDIYIQGVGCSLHTSQIDLSMTPAGLVTPETQAAIAPSSGHSWGNFEWTNPHKSSDFLSREFLEMFVKPSCVSQPAGVLSDLDQDLGTPASLLGRILEKSNDLAFFENTLANMSAAYLWNVWQGCDSPFEFKWPYQQCSGRSATYVADRATSAQYVSTNTFARLEIVQWKAAVTVLCSIILFVLALVLLGTKTDAERGVPLRQNRFIETAGLLKDSAIPEVVTSQTTRLDNTRLRFVSGGDSESLDRLEIVGDRDHRGW